MNRTLVVITILASLTSANADTLYIQNGPKVEGVFLSATASQIRFKGSDGLIKTYALSNVEGLEFSEPRPTAARAGSTLVIPAGTTITVRTIDSS